MDEGVIGIGPADRVECCHRCPRLGLHDKRCHPTRCTQELISKGVWSGAELVVCGSRSSGVL